MIFHVGEVICASIYIFFGAEDFSIIASVGYKRTHINNFYSFPWAAYQAKQKKS